MTATEDERSERRGVVVAIVLVAAINLPLIASNTIFGGDDWAWVSVYHTQGVSAILRHMIDAGHPGYGPLLDLFLFFGGPNVGRVAHGFAVGFHLGSGWLLWRIFRDARVSASFSSTLSILYLLAPYLADLHASWAHGLYDLVIFFYLSSLRLSLHHGYRWIAAALVAMLIGLTIETLLVLEPLRWWLLYHTRRDVRSVIRTSVPFLLLAGFLVVVRATLLVPQDVYSGYNAFVRPSFHEYLRLTIVNLWFFADIRQPLAFAAGLARFDNPAIFSVLSLGACLIAATAYRQRLEFSRRDLATLAIVAVIAIGGGMLPYIGIGREASRTDVSARFAVAAQFGVLLLGAIALQVLRPAGLRMAALAAIVLLFTADQFQLNKWLIYEGQVVGDFRRQVGAYLAQTNDQVLLIDFRPPAKDFLYLHRACLSSYDTNVGLERDGKRKGSFVYDRVCGPSVYADPMGCFLTGYDAPGTCPTERHDGTFLLKPDMTDFTRFRMIDLLRFTFWGPPLDAGTFQLTEGPS
jgi:hypothetical protein